MKITLNLIFVFFVILIKGQEEYKYILNDTLNDKYEDIETVIINDRDYQKIEYDFGLKQEINYGLKSVNPNVSYEIGLKFKNNLKQKGRISAITLFLKKTDSKDGLANLEINFYKIDTITGKPGEKINNQQIIYSPKNRRKTNVKINLESYKIPFPNEGVLVAVKWLPINDFAKSVGPAIRFTNYSERLTYTRHSNDQKTWNNDLNFSKKPGLYTNVMIGLDVYIKKRK